MEDDPSVIYRIISYEIFKLQQQTGQNVTMTSNTFSICRVPDRIRRDKEGHYDPSLLSIGPYHRGKQHLKSMEDLKGQVLQDLLKRTADNNRARSYYFQGLEDRARSCYFDTIELDEKRFAEMLLLDSCFIIDYFLNYEDDSRYGIYSSRWFTAQIMEDLLLLENQIPFFVIVAIYEFFYNSNAVGFVRKVAKHLSSMNSLQTHESPTDQLPIPAEEINHLLHLYYECIVPPQVLTPSDRQFISTLVKLAIPLRFISLLTYYWQSFSRGSSTRLKKKKPIVSSATKLVEAGVKIEKRVGKTVIDIAFSNGVLEIPPIEIINKTCLSNMVAWEQVTKGNKTISNYVEFMALLVNTPKDVEVLQQHGIITSYLKSNEDAALFFNQLGECALRDNKNFLIPLYEEISEYSESHWHQHRARLKRDYFNSPWAVISLVAATILLILTFLQTFFAIYTYFHPPPSSS